MLAFPPMTMFTRKDEASHPGVGGGDGGDGVGDGVGGGGGVGGGAGGGGIGGDRPCVGTSEIVCILDGSNPSTGPGVHCFRLRLAPVKSMSPPGPPGLQPLCPRVASPVNDSVMAVVLSDTWKPAVTFWLPKISTPAGFEHLFLSWFREKSATCPWTKLFNKRSPSNKFSPCEPVLAQCIVSQGQLLAPINMLAVTVQFAIAQVRPWGFGLLTRGIRPTGLEERLVQGPQVRPVRL